MRVIVEFRRRSTLADNSLWRLKEIQKNSPNLLSNRDKKRLRRNQELPKKSLKKEPSKSQSVSGK